MAHMNPERNKMDHINETLNSAPLKQSAGRVLAVGSKTWTLNEAVPRAILNWWVGAGRPDVTLVVEEGIVSDLAQATWKQATELPIEAHPASQGGTRRAERERLARITDAGFVHAFVFSTQDGYSREWLSSLYPSSGVAITVIEVTELEESQP